CLSSRCPAAPPATAPVTTPTAAPFQPPRAPPTAAPVAAPAPAPTSARLFSFELAQATSAREAKAAMMVFMAVRLVPDRENAADGRPLVRGACAASKTLRRQTPTAEAQHAAGRRCRSGLRTARR